MALQEQVMQWATAIGSWVILFVGIAAVGGVIILIAYYRQRQKEYAKYKVIVWEQYKDKDNNLIPVFVDLNEKGRIKFEKKLKRYFFHLKNANTHIGDKEGKEETSELDIGKVPYQKGGEVVFVQKLDHKKYAVGQPFIVDGKVNVKVTQADLAEAMRTYDLHVSMYGKKPNELMAFALYIGLAVIAMILIYVVVQKADVLGQIVNSNQEQAKLLLEIARTLKGSTVPSAVAG